MATSTDFYYHNHQQHGNSRIPPPRQHSRPTKATERVIRTSHDHRLGDARKIFLDDETAKPILCHPYEEPHSTSKALYYGTLKNQPFNDIATPDQAKFMEEQEGLDRRERQLWGGGLKHRIMPSSFWAGDWLRNNAFTYPRVQRHGRRLRLLERKKVLDRLTLSERNELVTWWVSKFGPIETPPGSPHEGKQSLLTRTLAHVRGTKYWRARQAKRRAREKEREEERNMTVRERMDKELYGANPNGRFDWIPARTATDSRLLY